MKLAHYFLLLSALGGIAFAKDPIIHASILNQMGLDHARLTFRHGGRDMRLTDVHGRVIKEVLA